MRNLSWLLVVLWVSSARASVQVVADGSGARRVEPRALAMRVQIAGGFASTTAQWTFSNAQTRPFEAEFIAEAPVDAVVTGFAYWFKGEKVVARIVEKTRAAQIYRGVVAQRRDPALVEMLARNFFRARISPVEAGQDLRIEVTWVQPLQWQKNVLLYRCPLWRSGEILNLQSWNFNANIITPGVTRIDNNFGATSKKRDGHFSVQAAGGDTPPQNLELRLPMGGEKPIFATATVKQGAPYIAILSPTTPPQNWLAGRSDVYSLRLSGGGWLSVARGSLPPQTTRLDVPGAAEKLWAAQKLDELGREEKNRPLGMKLSVRYGLPSQWTSWLAIPQEERVRLKTIIEAEKRAQAQRNLNVLGRQMALEVAAGGQKSRGYALMRAQFVENCRILELPVQPTLQSYFSRALADTNAALGYRGGNPWDGDAAKNLATARSLYQQVMRLGRVVPVASRPGWSQNAEANASENLGGALGAFNAQQVEKAILAGRSNAKLRTTLEAGAPAELGREARLKSLQVATQRLAQTWATQKALTKPDQSAIKALRTQVERLVARQKRLKPQEQPKLQDVLSNAESGIFSGRIYQIRDALSKEVIAGREKGARARELNAKLDAIAGKLTAPIEALNSEGGVMQQYILKTVGQLRREQAAFRPDVEKIDALQAELKRIEPFVPGDRFQYDVNYGDETWRREAPRALAARWAQARYGVEADERAAEFYAAKVQQVLDEEYEARKKSNPSFPYQRDAAENYLKQAESSWLGQQKTYETVNEIAAEQGMLRPDAAKIAALKASLDALLARTVYFQGQSEIWIKARRGEVFNSVLKHLREQLRQPRPDAALIADLEQRVIALQPFDPYYGQGGWSSGRRPSDPQEYGKLRVERITVRSQREKLQARLQKTPDDTELRARSVELARRENELTVRMGDPLIAVVAPADCQQVIAILPGGEIKILQFNAQNQQWEARFDVPTYMSEGQYFIAVIVVTKDGTRQRLQMPFRVDLTAPQGAANVQTRDAYWLLSLQTGPNTARVEVLLPWNERVDLKRENFPSNLEANVLQNRSFQSRVEVPPHWQRQTDKVAFLLTDLAHNRTRIEIAITP